MSSKIKTVQIVTIYEVTYFSCTSHNMFCSGCLMLYKNIPKLVLNNIKKCLHPEPNVMKICKWKSLPPSPEDIELSIGKCSKLTVVVHCFPSLFNINWRLDKTVVHIEYNIQLEQTSEGMPARAACCIMTPNAISARCTMRWKHVVQIYRFLGMNVYRT